MRVMAGVAAAFLLAGVAWAYPAPDAAPAPGDTTAQPAAPAAPPAAAPAPAVTVPPNGPVATIVTSLGTMTVTLDPVHAPIAVKNFIQYAKEKHFNGTVFYRVEPGFVIQAGSYLADGSFKGGLHKTIAFEGNNGLKNVHGAIAMARGSDPASAAAEFFIDLSDMPQLDQAPGDTTNSTGYAVFGQVTGGMDVLDKIGAVPVGSGIGPFPQAAPIIPVVIERVTISPAH
jgi:cyclophilin family peptidyl-prolyl cis-trans isomerase